MKTCKDLLSNVYYGTIRQIAEDLIKQIEDHYSFYEDPRNIKFIKDETTIESISSLLELAKETLLIYCGEGGIALKYTNFEVFVNKYFPEMLDKLRE